MKNPILILIALITLFVGCKIDVAGVPQSTNNTMLNGTWYLKSKITDNFVGAFASPPDTAKNFTKNDFYTFNADNTVNYASSSNTTIQKNYYSLTTTTSGQTLTIGSAAGGAGNAYTVNKLSIDSLILFTTTTTTPSGVSTTTNVTNLYTH
jgi:hypothetical protein